MKFLAILKDSVREAMDTSVFYVMAGLSALLIVVMASISFKPVSVEDDVKQFTGTFNWIMGLASQGRPAPHFGYAYVDWQRSVGRRQISARRGLLGCNPRTS